VGACSLLANTDPPVWSSRAGGAASAILESDRRDLLRADERNGDQGQVRGPAVLTADPHGKQAAAGTEVDRSIRPLMLRKKDRGIDGEARNYTIGITVCSPCAASRGAGPGARREVDAPR
jgi:hypothetical protein